MSQNFAGVMVWHEGKMVPYEKASVPLMSHTLHYGTGAFEGIRAYKTKSGPAIFRGPEHFERLIDSVKAFGGVLNFTPEQMLQGAVEVIRSNQFDECYLRPIAFLDDTNRGLKLPQNPRFLVSIVAWNWGKYLGDEAQTKGIRVKTSSFRRADVSSSLPAAKITGAYLTSVLARKEANDNGADEGLLLDAHGHVAEGSGENLFAVKNGHLFTPHTMSILPGITRQSVLEMAHSLGLKVEEKNMTRNDLYLADELFFTGTAVEVTAIREVDSRVVGKGAPGPITKRLGTLFFDIVEGRNDSFRNWLTLVQA